MDEDFLLSTQTAQKLYHEHAEKTPILDYNCHINPEEIAKDRQFENITQVWLGGDHYKWRQMKNILQVTRRIVKNFRNGRRPWRKRSEIRSIIGVIWN